MKNQYNPTDWVTTFDGTKARRKNCRFIKGNYYVTNSQCFKINGKYYRINNGKIIYDYECDKWILKDSAPLSNGIVGIESTGGYKLGNFTSNPTRNVTLLSSSIRSPYICLDEKTAIECGGVEDISTGHFHVHKGKGHRDDLSQKRTQERSFYGFPIVYGAAEMIPRFTKYFNQYYKPSYIGSNLIDAIKGYSFGIEYETDLGTIPERHLYRTGLIACRDGSIRGFEYVTIPMGGNRGLSAIYEHCDLINKYCEINPNNSLHVHIGGYPINKESVVALYRGLTHFQNEIFSMMPPGYKKTSQFKQRDYCSPLSKVSTSGGLEDAFLKVYDKLSGGEEFTGFNFYNHPMDRSGEHKWQVSPRYKYVNLIPLLFGNRGTVEFRVHPPSANPHKIINWLFITIGMVKFIQHHQDIFLRNAIPTKVDLFSTMKAVYPSEISSPLNKYIKYRIDMHSDGMDITGEREISQDKTIIPMECRL